MSNLHAKDTGKYEVQSLCELFGVSKQAYYKRDEGRIMVQAAKRSFALEYARQVRGKDPGMGIGKIWHMYREKFRIAGKTLGRDQFEALLAENGMKVRNRRRKPRTTDSSHGLRVYPNIVKAYIPEGINQLWVSDITYIDIWVSEEEYTFCYLSTVLDAYSRQIIGWSVGPDLTTAYPLKALDMALTHLRDYDSNLIHHSDRGVQYASHEYVKKLTSRNIRISMTEGGDPRDNAQAERINNTIKNELLRGMCFKSIDEVRRAMASAVDFYNNERPHMSLAMLTPAQAAGCLGMLDKRWHSYRDDAIMAMREQI